MSGDTLAFLEPHKRVFKDASGLPAYSYSQLLSMLRADYGDQLRPFQVFGDDMRSDRQAK